MSNNTVLYKEDDSQKLERPLHQIYFYLTEGCNLACRHCWLSPKLQSEKIQYPVLSVELFNSIITQAKPLGLKSAKLTGGEPFLHPNILDIIRIVKEQEIGLTIESNGVLCTEKIAEKLSMFNRISISISLDGADSETHEKIRGVPGCFNGAIQGIKNLKKFGINPMIIFTVMNHNKDQIDNIIELAESLDIRIIKFNIVQPTGRGKTISEHGESLTVKELIELNQKVRNIREKKEKMRLFFDLPPAFRSMSEMFAEGGDGCATCGILTILGVLANGNYALCGIGSHIEELVYGNASVDNLNDVWLNHKKLTELRDGLSKRFIGVCGQCAMKKMCNASCIAQNYYRTGNMWESFWFCSEAMEQGLFPMTRLLPNALN